MSADTESLADWLKRWPKMCPCGKWWNTATEALAHLKAEHGW